MGEARRNADERAMINGLSANILAMRIALTIHMAGLPFTDENIELCWSGLTLAGAGQDQFKTVVFGLVGDMHSIAEALSSKS